MKIYKLTGSGRGYHNFNYIVIANSKEEAKEIVTKKMKEYYYYDFSKTIFDEEIREEEIKIGLITYDDGECC